MSKGKISGLLLLSALVISGGVQKSIAQTAVSAAQPAAAPIATPVATPAANAAPADAAAAAAGSALPPTPAASASPASADAAPTIGRGEMIHRTLYAIYDKQDNHDLAAAELDELIRIKPGDPVFPFAYGQLLMKDSKWTDAIARFEASTKLDPTFSNAFCGIGDCQFKLKKYNDAIDSYTMAARNAKAGQSFTSKIAIARQWQERKQQEEDYAKALQKLNGPKPATKPGVKKK